MRLDLKSIIYVPGASRDFQFEMDLSDIELYGQMPVTHPVLVEGIVTNRAGALTLVGAATSLLDLSCDRCGKTFSREKAISYDFLLADKLEDEEHDEIILLEGNEVNLDEVVSTAFILALDTKNLCSDDCKGLCVRCGVDMNINACQCKPEVDPRFAALAQLLEDVN